MLSDAAQSVWAKTDRDTDEWMPLTRHLDDAAAVAALLWDRWLPSSVRRLVGEALPRGEADGRVLLGWLAGVHDIGKASPAFAVQVEETPFADRAEAMRRAGLPMRYPLADRAAVRHELVGHLALSSWLVGRHGFPVRVAATYAVTVGGHHGAPPERADLRRARDAPHLVGEGRWGEVRDELLTHMARVTGARDRLAAWSGVTLPVPAQVLLGAAVIVADWLASDTDLFPYQDDRRGEERAVKAWARAELSMPWSPGKPPTDDAALFEDRFDLPAGSSPRPVQSAVLRAARAAGTPGLVVVEAPMGEGKTEAALAAAEVLAHRAGAGGVFLALPTTATSDAMFARVLRWLEKLSSTSGEDLSTFLAHGRAALNSDARRLPRSGGARGVAVDADDTAAAHGRGSGAVADQWLHGRKRGPLSSVVVGTIDQVLFGALKSKHLVLRHLALAGKVVVIDEVHAVDVFMGSYLQRALHWLGAYGVPVVLLSATLASGQRRSLVTAYADGSAATGAPAAEVDRGLSGLGGLVGYPSVSTWSPLAGASVEVVASDASRRQRVELLRLDDDPEELVDLLRTQLADGGCAGVVRNTVTRAQETYELLRERLASWTGCEVVLVHSRFVAADRAERERGLADRLGPRVGVRTGRPERFVVVGTQVIEQSLDIDLDVMVTDLAPVDLLLQRIGRLHRHPRGQEQGERPPRLRRARCYVAGVEDWAAEPPRGVAGSRTVYGEAALLRSSAALADSLDAGGLTVPDDIAPLVEHAYTEDLEVPDAWSQTFAGAEEKRRLREAKQQRDAATFQLATVGPPRSSLVGWLADAAGEADDAGRGVAQVRDTEDSIEVVLVQRSGGRTTLLPWLSAHAGAEIATDWRPDDHLARAAATCTLRLPVQLSNARTADETIRALEMTFYAGWQDSPWLSGQLVLELDEHQSASIAGHRLTYDRERGLRTAREEDR